MTRASVCALIWLVALPASAHPGVDRASALVDEGRYEEADAEFARVLASERLTRDDLIALYEARALLDHARRDEAGLERTLLALASISPTHRFGPRFPPDLAARFVEIGGRIGGRLQVRVDRAPSPAGVTVQPRVEHDPVSLVREVRLRVFDAASGRWEDAEPPLTAAPGREVLLFVEAVGPGGAVLARQGSGEEPIRVQGPGAEPEGSRGAPPGATEELEGGFPDWGWAIVIGGIVVLVAAVVATIVYAVENPDIEWDPTSPTMR